MVRVGGCGVSGGIGVEVVVSVVASVLRFCHFRLTLGRIRLKKGHFDKTDKTRK